MSPLSSRKRSPRARAIGVIVVLLVLVAAYCAFHSFINDAMVTVFGWWSRRLVIT